MKTFIKISLCSNVVQEYSMPIRGITVIIGMFLKLMFNSIVRIQNIIVCSIYSLCFLVIYVIIFIAMDKIDFGSFVIIN